MNSLRSNILVVVVVAISCALWVGTEAYAQCSDPLINQAYRNVFNRPPDPGAPINGMRPAQITSTSGECNPNIYGGGSYTGNLSKLMTWVMASHVCQDPWIAEVFATELPGGQRLINNHNPTQLENGRPYSTMGQCNRSNYGSWRNFQELAANIQNFFSPRSRGRYPQGSPERAQLIRDAYQKGFGRAPSAAEFNYWENGVSDNDPRIQDEDALFKDMKAYVVNNPSALTSLIESSWQTAFGQPLSPNSREVAGLRPTVLQYKLLYQYPNGGLVALLQNNRSNPARIMQFPAQPAAPAPAPVPVTQVRPTTGPLLNPNVTPRPGMTPPLAATNPSSIISHNGSAIVASGGGNVVAAGGGNVVATGGGNVVAAGGGNLVSTGGGNYHTLSVDGSSRPPATDRSALIRTSYERALGREPSASELAYWNSVPANDARISSIEALIQNHRNYLRTNAAERQAMINRSYLAVFHRPVDAGSLRYWDGQVAASGATHEQLVAQHQRFKAQNPNYR